MNAARWSAKTLGVLVLGGALSSVACSSAPSENADTSQGALWKCTDDICSPPEPPDPCANARIPSGGIPHGNHGDTFLDTLEYYGCRGPNGNSEYLAIPTAKKNTTSWWLITECPDWAHSGVSSLQSSYTAPPYSATMNPASGYYAYSAYNACTSFALDSGYGTVTEFDPGCPNCHVY